MFLPLQINCNRVSTDIYPFLSPNTINFFFVAINKSFFLSIRPKTKPKSVEFASTKIVISIGLWKITWNFRNEITYYCNAFWKNQKVSYVSSCTLHDKLLHKVIGSIAILSVIIYSFSLNILSLAKEGFLFRINKMSHEIQLKCFSIYLDRLSFFCFFCCHRI